MEKQNKEIIAYLAGSIQIIEIFDSIETAKRKGYIVPKKFPQTSDKLCWDILDNFKTNFPKIPLIFGKLSSIIKAEATGVFLEEYKAPWEILGRISQTTLIKQLAENVDSKTEYKGGYWYRLYEYIEKYPIEYQNREQATISSKDVQLNVVLTVSSKLVSVNDLYKAKVIYKGGRPIASVYKNPKALEVASEIRKQLQAVDFSEYHEWLNKTKSFSVIFNFILKSGVSRRDLDNLSKMSCDTLVNHFNSLGVTEFDDAQFMEMHMYKSVNPSATKEYICVQFRESNHNIRFDILPKPEKVYLRSLGNIRTEVLETLEKNNLTWYDLEEDIWDKDYQNYQRTSQCNSIMYVVKDRKNLLELFSEITKDARICAQDEYKFMWIVLEDGDWVDSADVVSILETINVISDNSSRVRIIKDLINLIED